MKGRHFYVSLLAWAFLIIPNGVNAIWCFQCNSEFDPDCHTVQKNETMVSMHYRECKQRHNLEALRYYPEIELFCWKIVQTIFVRDGLVRTVRRCGWKLHERNERMDRDCYSVKAVSHEEIVCQCFEDACNGSYGIKASLLHLILPVSIILGLRYT